jgi:hypothetical protein
VRNRKNSARRGYQLQGYMVHILWFYLWNWIACDRRGWLGQNQVTRTIRPNRRERNSQNSARRGYQIRGCRLHILWIYVWNADRLWQTRVAWSTSDNSDYQNKPSGELERNREFSKELCMRSINCASVWNTIDIY